jgi:mono/diheme cytochrome c family protein
VPELKYVPAPLTSPTSAKEMFKAYCASCHGNSAKGDGPAAPALRIPPPDLTKLSKKNGGKFPSDRVLSILREQATLAAQWEPGDAGLGTRILADEPGA